MEETKNYEVEAEVPDDLAEEFEAYMRGKHIPDILATGCFAAASMEQCGDGKYLMKYRPRTKADYDRYLAEHAEALRSDFRSRFPDRITVKRSANTDSAKG